MNKYLICAFVISCSCSAADADIPSPKISQILDVVKTMHNKQHLRVSVHKSASDVEGIELKGTMFFAKKARIEFHKTVNLAPDKTSKTARAEIIKFSDLDASPTEPALMIYLKSVVVKNAKKETLMAADVQTEYETTEYKILRRHNKETDTDYKHIAVLCGISVYIKRGDFYSTPSECTTVGQADSSLKMAIEKLFA